MQDESTFTVRFNFQNQNMTLEKEVAGLTLTFMCIILD